MLFYLDNCCFNRPFDDQSQLRIRLESEAKLSLQDLIREDDHQLVWSYILEFENEANPFKERKVRIMEWKALSAVSVAPSDELVDHAKRFHEFGVKKKEAFILHVLLLEKPTFFSPLTMGYCGKRK